MRLDGFLYWSPQFREAQQFATAVRKHGGPAAMSSLLNKFKVDQDREQAEEQFQAVMGISNIPAFTL